MTFFNGKKIHKHKNKNIYKVYYYIFLDGKFTTTKNQYKDKLYILPLCIILYT